MKCKKCPEYKNSWSECTYITCRSDRFDLFNHSDISNFCIELYNKTGVYVNEFVLRKHIKELKDYV